jgi:hypothetical protein
MHIQKLRLPIRQGPFDIGQMLRSQCAVGLIDMQAEFHWPVREVQFIKGPPYILLE